MNPIGPIVGAFTSFWLWTVVISLTAAFAWLINEELSKKLNRDQLDRLLDGRHYAIFYHELLQAALDRVDRWLTPNYRTF